MQANELYKAGRLREAIEEQVLQVRAAPTDHARRLFLYELLVFAGDLDRARRQIEAIEYKDADLDAATAVYRKLLDAEQARRDLFARGVAPGFFGESPEHLRLRPPGRGRLGPRAGQRGRAGLHGPVE
jgi:type VI secretion system protein ImpE